ncbi:prepilin-type N-terminal cleavage/methylation domain-containing protein [Chitinispirillales bacterium ANBcel5]|uniref:type IV pilus modification PilV family protein n=1 Tax=Cellulosispirillum alkaliphilum TaxID=3039283 RepID=UPI002A51B359|nr:prepilin-type N-terminal cleavage/methylation domain-containing protein [Chitinispirillales bacterium ANBcel5]
MNTGNNRGSSMVEVIVAMFILALLITGLNASVVHLVNSNLASKEISEATAMGNKILERLRREEYGNVVSGFDTIDDKFIRSWTVTDESHLRRVQLHVEWPSMGGRRQISMSTIISRP